MKRRKMQEKSENGERFFSAGAWGAKWGVDFHKKYTFGLDKVPNVLAVCENQRKTIAKTGQI